MLTAVALVAACAGPRGTTPQPPDPTNAPATAPESSPAPSPDADRPELEPPSHEHDRPRPPDRIAPFESAQELGDVLVAAEAALADPETPEDDRDQWAWAHQQAYRDLAQTPAWRDEVRPRIPEALRPAFDLTLRAADELHRLTTPRRELPAGWRIVAPPPLDELRGYYEEAEDATGSPWHVLAAIHLVETRFGRIQGDSHAGAQGPMQFMPPTWEAYGEGEVTDPRDAILAAGRYLAANGAPDDLRAAVFAYNRSERYVEAVLAHAEAIARFEHYLDVHHRWRVYYRTVDGDVVLEEGYGT